MKLRTFTIAATLALALLAATLGSASATDAAPKPGFPAGTWIGAGYGEAEIALDGDLITLYSTNLNFTLNVSKGGAVTGTGMLRSLQTGSGSVGSKITGVAKLTFSGTPTNIRYAGTQVVTTKFIDAAHVDGTSFERKISGGFVPRKARSCRVSGGHRFQGVTFNWQARLKGVKCP
ncbi:MAG: hypothetical protein ACRDPX_09205 [Gaiellaceae bacterium]